MSHLLTALFTLAGVLWFLFFVVAIPLLILALSPRAVMRRRRQVARFTQRLDTLLANQPTTWKGRP